MPSQQDSLSCTRTALNPHARIAATEPGLASSLPSKMLFWLTHAYSVPALLAPRRPTGRPRASIRWLPRTASDSGGWALAWTGRCSAPARARPRSASSRSNRLIPIPPSRLLPASRSSRPRRARRSLPGEGFAGGLRPRGGHQHVAGAGGEHFRHVEAGRAAQHAGDALLEQQALDELRLALVERARHLHELAFGVLTL